MEIENTIDLRTGMVNAFIRAVEQNKNFVVLVSDSVSTSKIKPFKDKYPDRLVNVGIAEQNLVGIAAGMALGGFIAVTCNAAPFLIARSHEQVKNDICYSNTNVKLVGLNAGFAYGPLAATHHAIDDIAVMRTLGNILILAPADPVETEQIFDFAIDYTGPVYIRLDNAKFPVLHDNNYTFKCGDPDVLTNGPDVCVFAVGSVVQNAFKAALQLETKEISPTVVNCSSIRPVNKKKLATIAAKFKQIITVEEHSVNGGLGSLIAEVIAENGLHSKLTRLGIHDGEFAKAGPRNELQAFYKIDQNGIKSVIQNVLKY